MELVLVRHGRPINTSSTTGPVDPPLDDVGRAQADAVALWLADDPVDAVYTSPQRRARETARPLAEKHGLEIQVVDGLAEYDRDSNSYMTLEEMKATDDPRWLDMKAGDHFSAYGVSGPDFQAAVVETIEGLVSAHPGQRIAAVCHAGVINVYLSAVLGADKLIFFEPTYTSVSRVLASSRGHRNIASVNESGHLRGL